jgi:type IV pilus assembly protein PilW
MQRLSIQRFGRRHAAANAGGFTMIEILVAMAAAALVLIGSVSSYFFLQDTYKKHKQFAKAHRKLRGSVAIAATDFQSAGRSGLQPRLTNTYGIQDIRRKDLDGNDDPNGSPSLTYTTLTYDRDGNGRLEDADSPPDRIVYRLYDDGADGVVDLGRQTTDVNGTRMELLARNVEAIGFAFAVDANRDGVIDTNTISPTVTVTQWCVDTNNDNVLDAQLDRTLDGLIDRYDDNEWSTTQGFGLLDAAPLGANVPLTRIRQVTIYVLVRADLPEPGYVNKNTYVVGETVWHPVDASDPMSQFRRKVVSIGITLRNHEEDLAL